MLAYVTCMYTGGQNYERYEHFICVMSKDIVYSIYIYSSIYMLASTLHRACKHNSNSIKRVIIMTARYAPTYPRYQLVRLR